MSNANTQITSAVSRIMARTTEQDRTAHQAVRFQGATMRVLVVTTTGVLVNGEAPSVDDMLSGDWRVYQSPTLSRMLAKHRVDASGPAHAPGRE